MKGKRLRWKYIAAAGALLVVGIIVWRARHSSADDPIIRTATVKRGIVTSSVSGNGVLQPITTVQVKSNVGGSIVKLAVDEGDYVKEGQLIARIDPSDTLTSLLQAEADLSSANAKVAQTKQASILQQLQTSSSVAGAEQSLEVAKQRLAQAAQQAAIQPKLTVEAVKLAESSLASAEATLSQTKTALVPQKLVAAQAAYDQAKATYDQADLDVKRQRALLEKGFVSKSQVDASEQQFSVAKAQLDSAKKKSDTVQGEADQDLNNAQAKADQATASRETALANRVQNALKLEDLAAAKAAVKQATATLAAAKALAYQNQMKGEDIAQAQAQLRKSQAADKNAHTQLGYTTVVAPRSGVVVKKYVDEGSIITAGRSAIGGGAGAGIAIVDIADTSKMWVVVNVDETDIAKIEMGQEVDVGVDAYPDELFTGKVIKVAPQAIVDQNVTTVPVTVELEDADARLKPTMNATCDFITERKKDVLYVPSEAIKETDSGVTVTVMDHGKQVERKVKVGIVGNDSTEILSGLRDGETVVTAIVEPTQTTATPAQSSSASSKRRGPPMF